MSKTRYVDIPVPVHAAEKKLPRSMVQYQLLSGEIVTISNVPLQGPKTLQNILDTLHIWQRAEEEPAPEYQI